MIARSKVVECNYCHSKAIMDRVIYPEGSWWELPAGWVEVNHRIHFCPKCAHAIDILRDPTSVSAKNVTKM